MGKWKEKNRIKLLNKVEKSAMSIPKHLKGFTPVANTVLCNDMPSTFYKVLNVLTSMAYGNEKECFPSNALIAVYINRSIRTVQRATKYLRENGYISVTHRFNNSNIYKILTKVILKKQDKNNKFKAPVKKSKNIDDYERDFYAHEDNLTNPAFDDLVKVQILRS